MTADEGAGEAAVIASPATRRGGGDLRRGLARRNGRSMTRPAPGNGALNGVNGRRIPLAKEGLPFVLPLGILGVLLTSCTPWGALAFLPALFCVWFFRDPRREPPLGEGLLLSPADGKVVLIQAMHEPRFLNRNCTRVSIFMSPMDVHVNRMPLAGQVMNVRYTEGRYHVASKPVASRLNEQNAIHIRSEAGDELMVVQIAGTLARRIVCDVRPGHRLGAGDRIGLIRFGSRVDVYIPEGFDLRVREGDVVRTSRTILAARARCAE